jgi:hypothetical protein
MIRLASMVALFLVFCFVALPVIMAGGIPPLTVLGILLGLLVLAFRS